MVEDKPSPLLWQFFVLLASLAPDCPVTSLKLSQENILNYVCINNMITAGRSCHTQKRAVSTRGLLWFSPCYNANTQFLLTLVFFSVTAFYFATKLGDTKFLLKYQLLGRQCLKAWRYRPGMCIRTHLLRLTQIKIYFKSILPSHIPRGLLSLLLFAWKQALISLLHKQEVLLLHQMKISNFIENATINLF